MDFLEVQWLRVHLPVLGGAGSIPGWGAKIPQCLVAKEPKHKTEAIL